MIVVARRYDPLHFVPSPDAVRVKLAEALSLADRLRLLLDLAERMQLLTNPPAGTTPPIIAAPRPEAGR